MFMPSPKPVLANVEGANVHTNAPKMNAMTKGKMALLQIVLRLVNMYIHRLIAKGNVIPS